MRKPSRYQSAIREWVRHGEGNAFVDAVAGSGKTSTLEWLAPEVPGALFLAFNRHIATELATRIGDNVSVSTVHSHGFAAVRQRYPAASVKSGKYRDMTYDVIKAISADGVLPEWCMQGVEARDRRVTAGHRDAVSECWPVAEMTRLLDLLRVSLTDDVHALVDHHGLPVSHDVAGLIAHIAPMILRRGRELAPEMVDFTDMLWLPATDPSIRPRQHQWVLVDEAQDLSAAQLEVAIQSCAPGGRMLFVGDRRQAIYGFAGADCRSVDAIVSRTNATDLPLSICYRCPSSHLDLARAIVPQIEARPDADPGSVRYVSRDQAVAEIDSSCLVLCRVTAPLIGLCYEMISAGRPARVRGRDIGAGLKSLVKQVMRPRRANWGDIQSLIKTWRDREIKKVLERNNSDHEDPAIQSIGDRCDCASLIASKASNRDRFDAIVDEMFADEDDAIQMSTVHRAKGLEALSVYLLRPELMPFPYARKDWQITQEWNLRYVALTRSLQHLVFIDDPSAPKGVEPVTEPTTTDAAPTPPSEVDPDGWIAFASREHAWDAAE